MSWRLDRPDAEPEFYETKKAAESRAWALTHIAGEKRVVLVWEDLAEYAPIEGDVA